MWRKRPEARRPAGKRLVFEQLESRRVLAPVPVLTSVAFITPAQSFTDGSFSGIIKVELKDQFGNPFNATSNVAVTLSTTSIKGSFENYPSNAVIPSGGTITIAKGTNTANFRYTDSVAGTPTITAKDGALTATQQETVVPGAPSQVVFLPTSQSIITGAFNPVTIELLDSAGNPSLAPANSNIVTVTKLPKGPSWTVTTGVGAGQQVTLSTSSATGQFFTSPTSTTPVTRVVVPAGQSTLTFYYVDTTLETSTVSADGAKLTAGSQTETGTAGASQIVFAAPVTFTAGVAKTDSLQIDNYKGIATAPAAGSTITLTSPIATGKFTGFSLPPADVSGNNTNSVTLTLPAATTSISFSYTDTKAESVTFTATGTNGPAFLQPGSQTNTVVPGPASQAVFLPSSATQTTTVAASAAITVQLQDQYGNAVTAPAGGQVVSLSSSSPSGIFHLTSGGASITQVTIPAGSTSTSFTYSDITPSGPSGYTLTASATVAGVSPPPVTGTETMIVISVPTAITVSPAGFGTLTASLTTSATSVSATIVDGNGNKVLTSKTTSVTISSSSATGALTVTAPVGDVVTNNGTNSVTVTIPADTLASGISFSYSDTKAGTPTIKVKDTTDGVTSPSVTATIVAAAPSQVLFVTTSPQTVTLSTTTGLPLPLTINIQLEDKFGNAAQATTPQTIGVSDNGGGGTFAQSSVAVTSVTVPVGGSAASFTYTASFGGTVTISLSSFTLNVPITPLTVNVPLINSSFEFPITTGYTPLNGSVAGWIWTPPADDPLSSVGVSVGAAASPNGSPFFLGTAPGGGRQAAAFFDYQGSGPAIEQFVNLAAGTYTISWFQIAPPSATPAAIYLSVDNNPPTVFTDSNAQVWTQYSQQFTVTTGGQHEIQFLAFIPIFVAGDLASIDLVNIVPS